MTAVALGFGPRGQTVSDHEQQSLVARAPSTCMTLRGDPGQGR